VHLICEICVCVHLRSGGLCGSSPHSCSFVEIRGQSLPRSGNISLGRQFPRLKFPPLFGHLSPFFFHLSSTAQPPMNPAAADSGLARLPRPTRSTAAFYLVGHSVT
jgi:hypothetical protein